MKELCLRFKRGKDNEVIVSCAYVWSMGSFNGREASKSPSPSDKKMECQVRYFFALGLEVENSQLKISMVAAFLF